jgi:hypothetical protein
MVLDATERDTAPERRRDSKLSKAWLNCLQPFESKQKFIRVI